MIWHDIFIVVGDQHFYFPIFILGKKLKAALNTKMPKKNPPPKDEKPQKQRFIDTARELEADESGKAFERGFKAVVKPKK